MNSFEAYRTFVALKRHFARGSTYDFHKYCGKVNVKPSSFETRGDRFWYEKLSKIRDPLTFMVANVSIKPNLWVGDLMCEEANENYVRWCKVTESITYHVGQQLSQFDSRASFNSVFVFDGTGHPPALKAMLDGSLSPEVLAVLDQLIGFTRHWDKHSWDPTVKGTVHLIRKLRGFIQFDPDAIKREVKKIFDRQREDDVAA